MPARKAYSAPKSGTGAPIVLESEQAALGAAIRDPAIAEQLTSELTASDFYNQSNHNVFTALCGLSGDGLDVHPASVSERSGVSRSDVDSLVDAGMGVGSGQLKTLLSDLKRTGSLRIVYNACLNASSGVTKSSKLEEVLESLEADLYKIDRSGANEAQDGAEVLQKAVQSFLERKASGGGVVISTGLRDLDRAILGFRPGKMGVVAARPSMGKTAFSGTLRRAVVQQGFGAIEFSLEMSAEELLERELAFQAQVDMRKILRAKDVSDEEVQRVIGAGGAGIQGRWFIDDRTYSIAGVRRRARIVSQRMARQGVKLGLVVLDYIQLAGENGDGREQSVAAISRGCKLMAKELDCTVLALSQLNRSCEFREDRRPMLSDLRESGSIEQDADWVGFIYREHLYDTSYPPEDAEFIIRKQRSGPLGTVHLRYSPKLVSFSDRPAQVQVTTDGNSDSTQD